MYAAAKLDTAVGRHAGIALVHTVLDFDRAAYRVDNAAEFDQKSVAGTLDHPAAIHLDGRIDQVAAQRPEPRQRAIFIRAGETAETDHIGGKDSGELARLGHRRMCV